MLLTGDVLDDVVTSPQHLVDKLVSALNSLVCSLGEGLASNVVVILNSNFNKKKIAKLTSRWWLMMCILFG